MTFKFNDSVTIDGTRIRSDGYLVVDARTARTGVQRYLGSEVGKPDVPFVDVYRPPEQVFSTDSMVSFTHRPVTNDHPPEAVTADNWKKYAVGHSSGEVQRDGEFLRVPLMIADRATISEIENGKRELSNGYACDLDFTSGITPDGQKYDAIQTNIRGNHIAIVKAGRAGSQCRIGDGSGNNNGWSGVSPVTVSTKDSTMSDRNITVDGIPVATNDAGATVIEKLVADRAVLRDQLDAANKAMKKAEEEKEEALAKKDAAIEDAKSKILDQSAIDKLVADRVALESTAKAIHKDVKTAGVSDTDLKKAVVVAKLGDDALKMADGKDETYVRAFIDARFDTLAEDAAKNRDQFRDAIRSGGAVVTNLNDVAAQRQAAFDNLIKFDQTGRDEKTGA